MKCMPVFFDFETLIARRGRPRTFTRYFELGAVCSKSKRIVSSLVDPIVEWEVTDAESLVMAVYETGMNPRPSIRFWGRTLKRKGHPYFEERYRHHFRNRHELKPLPYLDTATDYAYAHSLRDVVVNGRKLGGHGVFALRHPMDAIDDLRDLVHEEGDKCLVAHNGKSFDFHVLRGSISRHCHDKNYLDGISLLDSIPIFRKAMPRFKSYSQPFLYSAIFGEQYDAHIAIDDARALRRIWEHGVSSSKMRLKVGGRPISKSIPGSGHTDDRPIIVCAQEKEKKTSDHVTSIPGIGPSTARALGKLKITTVTQLRELWLERRRNGETLKGVVRFWRKVGKYFEDENK